MKALETGVVPPVPNFRDPDPELGELNLSGGGSYPVRYALRLAAGFGSQITMLLLRWTPVADGRRRNADELGYDYRIADRAAWTAWLRRVSGYEDPQLEVVQHRLRVADQGPPAGGPLEPAAVPDVAPAEIEPAALEAEPAPAARPRTRRAEPRPERGRAARARAGRPPRSAGVEERVLAIVAEQTGYPPDLLDMDLDLEADLGIDTVKQAEVFATIREAYGIEFDDTLKLRDYPTLNHVVGFVRERSGAAAPEPRAGAASRRAGPAPAPAPAPPAAGRRRRRAAGAGDGRRADRLPADLLDMDLDLEADLGIDTVKQAEVFATIREAYGIELRRHAEAARLPDPQPRRRVRPRARRPRRRAGGARARGRTAPAAPAGARAAPAAAGGWRRGSRCWSWSPSRPATRRTCSTWTSTSRPTWGSTRSSRPRCSRPSARPTGSRFDDTLKLRDYPTLNHVVGVRPRARARRRAAPRSP